MKIAFASDDGKSIAAHFGHSVCYLVLTVENGKVAQRELRNAGGRASGNEHSHECNQGDTCQCLTKPIQGHAGRLTLLRDCEAVVAFGMGPRAITALQAAGIKPVVLRKTMTPEDAALAYARGDLEASVSAGGCCSPDPY